MSMRETIGVINQMEIDGAVGRYAIGGAVAAFLYVEVAFTEDLDILVSFENQREPSGLILLGPILGYLAGKGFSEFRKEGVIVHGWPVQFLPVASRLDQEGLDEAVLTDLPVDAETKIQCRVLRAEHLMATALAVGRPKDYVRLTQFIQAGSYDQQYLREILERHKLSEKWSAFCDKFDILDPSSNSGNKP